MGAVIPPLCSRGSSHHRDEGADALVYQGSASCHLPLGAQLSQHPTAQCLEVVKLDPPPWALPSTLCTAGTRHDYCAQKACKGRAAHRNSVPPGRSELWPRPHNLGKQGPNKLSAWVRFREPHGGGKTRVRAGGEAFTGQREAKGTPAAPRASPEAGWPWRLGRWTQGGQRGPGGRGQD